MKEDDYIVPYEWSHNWTQNYRILSRICSSVAFICRMNKRDLEVLQQFKVTHFASRVQPGNLLDIANAGYLIDWIESGTHLSSKSKYVPRRYILSSTGSEFATKYSSLFASFLQRKKEDVSGLIETVESIQVEIDTKLKDFLEDSKIGEYSSYSDYSETSSDSEDEDIDFEEDDIEEEDATDTPPRRRHH